MNDFAGTGALARLIVRRDWLKLLIWVLLISVIPISMAAGFQTLYPTDAALREYAEAIRGSAAEVGMLGYVYEASVGGLTAWRAGLNGAFLIVPVAILFAIRHTRSEESSGRQELLSATVVGRLAPVTAMLIVVFSANLCIAVLTAVGLSAIGLPAGGAWIYGLSAAAAGCVFTALAGLIAQVTESTGAARAITLALFALSWVARTVGDLSGGPNSEGWLSWISPLGWLRLTRAFAGERWWVLGLSAVLIAACVAAAYALARRRDLGSGLLPTRPGAATAAPGLSTPLALAWRLHRNALGAWAIGAALFGLLLGNVAVTISSFVDSPAFRQWSEGLGIGNPGDAFLYLVLYVLGQVVSAYAITVALRLRTEEVDGRAEVVLAEPVSRMRWAGSHLLLAVLNPALVLGVLGLAIGLGFGLTSGDPGRDLPRLFARTLVTLPAIWLMAGLTTALYGWLPRVAAAVSWGALVLFLALELAWEFRQIDSAVFGLSPFAHVHFAQPITAAALAALTLIAAALMGGGLLGLRRRDIGQ